MSTFEIVLDQNDLRDLLRKIDAVPFPEVVARGLTDLVHVGEGEVKARTPVVTGNLRRSEQSDVTKVRAWPAPEGRVFTRQPYAYPWIEEGYRDDPRFGRVFLKTRPGGYRMFEEGFKETERQADSVLRQVARGIEAEWGR